MSPSGLEQMVDFFFFSFHHLETKTAESLEEKVFLPKKTADVGLKAVEFFAVFSTGLLLKTPSKYAVY